MTCPTPGHSIPGPNGPIPTPQTGCPTCTPLPLPTAAEVLALLAAEHSPFRREPRGTLYCRWCSNPQVTVWPCRVHMLATQPTAESAALGARLRPQEREAHPDPYGR